MHRCIAVTHSCGVTNNFTVEYFCHASSIRSFVLWFWKRFWEAAIMRMVSSRQDWNNAVFESKACRSFAVPIALSVATQDRRLEKHCPY